MFGTDIQHGFFRGRGQSQGGGGSSWSGFLGQWAGGAEGGQGVGVRGGEGHRGFKSAFSPGWHNLLLAPMLHRSLLLVLLTTLAVGQTVNLSQIYSPSTAATLGPEYSDPAFLKLLDNYFGCKTWEEGLCAVCSQGYVFNKAGVCCSVDPHCQNFNRDVGICELCYTGYQVAANGSCAQGNLNTEANIGCAQWNNNKCQKCSVRYFFNADGVCAPVSDHCREWNADGSCTSCYVGFAVQKGVCAPVAAPLTSEVVGNPLCASWVGGVCVGCAQRTYLGKDGVCVPVADNCNTWDKADGLCVSCYKGYELKSGVCGAVDLAASLPSDPGCKTWQGETCLECSANWVFNAKKFCIPVADLCKTHDDTGSCLTCFAGYDLSNGSCLYSDSNSAKPKDGGCKTWNWAESHCTLCSDRWVFNPDGLCIPTSDLCREHDAAGLCTACFKGYDLNKGACEFSPSNTQPLTDAGCKIWDYATNKCAECSNRWFNANGVCQPVSDLCSASDEAGLCTACYKGYDLKDGLCAFSASNNAQPADVGCKVWSNGNCVECSSSWVFNANKVCVPVSDQCRTHDDSGSCITCYVGYDLNNGSCIFSESNHAQPKDGGCKTWSWTDSVCKECSSQWVFNANGLCVPVSDLCREHDAAGLCTACFKGYGVSNGSCVVAAEAPVSDVGCKIWDWSNGKCLGCSSNWFLGGNGLCATVSDLCKAFDAGSGQCLSCYEGYDLSGGACVFSASNTASPADAGCKTWSKGVCTECSSNWAFNTNNICTPVSDLCKTSSGLACTSCFNGYVLVNSSCIFSPLNSAAPSDVGCKKWDWNKQVCLECSFFWFFSEGKCQPVSDLCKTYDNATGGCLSCYKGYDLVNASCVLSQSKLTPTDLGCAEWNWEGQVCLGCSQNWYLANGTCHAVSPYCKTHNADGACTSCYTGYGLASGQCSPVSTLCKTGDESGCLTCYKGYALYKKQCVALGSIADIALYYAECCPEKLAQLQAEGRIPK